MHTVIFTASFYLALTICLTGTIYRVSNWFRFKIGPDAARYSARERMAAALKGIIRTVLGRRFFAILKVLVLDVLFQVRILKSGFSRWLMHMCIFAGVMLLVLMHALGESITQALFPDYASTLNPFMFLRNLFGSMVVLGIAIALYRRLTVEDLRRTTNSGDRFAIVLLATIIFSGFLLESVQILSSSIFDQMVKDYSGAVETEEIKPLKAYWEQEFGVVFPGAVHPTDPEYLKKGRLLHEESCAACHTRPKSAFVSYPIAKAIRPAGRILNEVRLDIWLRYIHFLACFLGLAYLPFGKFFHLIATPFNLTVHAGEEPTLSDPANIATRRAMALDACTHCGLCSLHCSVAPVFRLNPNANILPSEKLISIKAVASGQHLGSTTLEAISEGSFICTNCYRCTTICPSGINLQDLWNASKEDLITKGFPQPHIWVRELTAAEWADRISDHERVCFADEKPTHLYINLADRAETFAPCLQCTTCTDVCPVVATTDNPSRDLDLTPQQVMNMLRLGLKEMALGSRMVWSCVTCYMCQEHCPQGIKVADILYELRNIACDRLKEVRQVGQTEKNNPGSRDTKP